MNLGSSSGVKGYSLDRADELYGGKRGQNGTVQHFIGNGCNKITYNGGNMYYGSTKFGFRILYRKKGL